MAVTLYVGNLAWSLTEDELVDAFATVTEIQAVRIIHDRETGRSRGFGFVEVTEADAEKVVRDMNGYELRGRKLIVNQARPRLDES